MHSSESVLNPHAPSHKTNRQYHPRDVGRNEDQGFEFGAPLRTLEKPIEARARGRRGPRTANKRSKEGPMTTTGDSGLQRKQEIRIAGEVRCPFWCGASESSSAESHQSIR